MQPARGAKPGAETMRWASSRAVRKSVVKGCSKAYFFRKRRAISTIR